MKTTTVNTTSTTAHAITRRRSSVRCSTSGIRPSSASAAVIAQARQSFASAERSRSGEAVVGNVVVRDLVGNRSRGQRGVIRLLDLTGLLRRDRPGCVVVVEHVLELIPHRVLHTSELAHCRADLPGDIGEALRPEDDQRYHENEEDLFGSEAHGEEVP